MPSARRALTMVDVIIVASAIAFAAALALPHLGNKQREERIAKLQAAQGAVRSAAALLHGVARSRHNQPQPACAAAGFGSNPPRLDAAGDGNLCTDSARVQVALLYPAPTPAGIVAGAGLVPVFGTPSAAQLAREGYEVLALANGLQLRLRGGRDATRCAFVYRAPPALGQAPLVSAAVTEGC